MNNQEITIHEYTYYSVQRQLTHKIKNVSSQGKAKQAVKEMSRHIGRDMKVIVVLNDEEHGGKAYIFEGSKMLMAYGRNVPLAVSAICCLPMNCYGVDSVIDEYGEKMRREFLISEIDTREIPF